MHHAGEFIMIITDVDHIIWILILNVYYGFDIILCNVLFIL